jgi:hybrid cluster-associated redox disulfide protein
MSSVGTLSHLLLQNSVAIGVMADIGQAAPNMSHDEYVAIRSAAMRRNLAPGQRAHLAGRVTIQLRMEGLMPIGFDDLVDDVMSGAPETIRVFLAFRMRCVGCPIACFHTVDDACREHGVDRDSFLNALRAVLAETMA